MKKAKTVEVNGKKRSWNRRVGYVRMGAYKNKTDKRWRGRLKRATRADKEQ